MKNTALNLFVVLTVLFAASCENKKTDSKKQAEEQNEEKLSGDAERVANRFVTEVADAGMLEVELGKLAVKKATHKEVKKFATMLVADHSAANEELKGLAASKNISIPAALSERSQEEYDDLNKKSGHDFDKEYIDEMVKSHKDGIDKFEKEADKGDDPDVKAWAAGKLPTLRQHLAEAEKLQDMLKKMNGKSSNTTSTTKKY